MKFLAYATYLMVDLNDFLTKFCLNNLISVLYIYIYINLFFLSNGSLFTYVVRILFW